MKSNQIKSNQITISGPVQSGKFTLAKLWATYLRSLGFEIQLDLLGETKDPNESDLAEATRDRRDENV